MSAAFLEATSNEPKGGSSGKLDEVLADYMRLLDRGEQVEQQALIDAHPSLATELRDYFSQAEAMERMAAGTTADCVHEATPRGALEVRCPSCHAPIEVAVDTLLTDLSCSAWGGT